MSTECSRCGDRSKAIEFHHYAPKVAFGTAIANSFPVRPMCRTCHAEFHAGETLDAKSAVNRLDWSQMPQDGRPCERLGCRRVDTKILDYAFWGPHSGFHAGPVCWSCFEVFVAGQRDHHRVPTRTRKAVV